MDKHEFTSALQRAWKTDSRWDGVTRPYTAADVHRLRGSIDIEYSLARYGADRLASVKKCGHLGGKVLVPTSEFVTKLVAARLAADVCGVDTILIARTDANSATLLTSDCDEYDRRFVTGERTAEGFFRVRDGVEAAIARALAYAPYADLLWFETSKPDLTEATRFAAAIHERFPGKQ